MTAARVPAPREPIGPARWYRLRELLERVADDDPRHERDIAAGLIDELSADEVRELALETLEASIWDRRRRRQARVEREAVEQERAEQRAEVQRRQREQRALETEPRGSKFGRVLDDPGLIYGPGSRMYDYGFSHRRERDKFARWAGDRFDEWHERARVIVETHPETCSPNLFAEDWYQGGPAAYQRMKAARRMAQMVDELVAETRLQVTAELLGSEFALGDGRRVTWGAATVAEHEQRAELLMGNATANAEAAARHLAAVEMLRERGVGTLADLADSPVPAVAS